MAVCLHAGKHFLGKAWPVVTFGRNGASRNWLRIVWSRVRSSHLKICPSMNETISNTHLLSFYSIAGTVAKDCTLVCLVNHFFLTSITIFMTDLISRQVRTIKQNGL